ncbi:MAG TPA: transketolase [Planctomycetota bacterium]|nr:transketolase [Planctomycetota bacterium]
MTTTDASLLTLVANTIRGLAMDAVEKANSGHPGMPMGMADVAAVLWLEHLRHSPKDPHWLGRDRFVLSAGHGSMLLYALLHLSGYRVSLDDLKQFRQWHSRTPGHPEFGETDGVETTTGPLGQGFANGVGMAIAAQMEAAHTGCSMLKTRVLGIVSDGDLMEGISAEAASLAGHLQLDNLLYVYDDNRITIDGKTDITFSDDVAVRFRGHHWDVYQMNAHDVAEIERTLTQALGNLRRPTLVIARSHIAKGSPGKQDSPEAHGAPLGAEEVRRAKQALGLPDEPFYVPEAVRELFAKRAQVLEAERARFEERFEAWRTHHPEGAKKHAALRAFTPPADVLTELLAAAGTEAAATRVLSGKVIQKAAALFPRLVSGSADLASSTKTDIKATTSVQAGMFSGRNLHFGVREHAMGAVMNGIALHGAFQPLGSTFLVFSDYMRPAIRLAAIMKLPCVFVFTHDSLMVGEDGPTHQPIEHVASLRLIPNVHVLRPADGPEVAAAYAHALQRTDGPSILCLTRQNVPALERAPGFDVRDLLRGGYLLQDAPGAAGTLVATGSEVSLAVAAARLLQERGTTVRVVSVPCLEVFLAQDEEYRRAVLPPGLPAIALEMGRPEIWCSLTGSLERVIGVTRFGASAPAGVLAEKYGFTPAAVAERVQQMLAAR